MKDIRLIVLMLSLIVFGCSESFFEKTPTETISDKDLKKAVEMNGDLSSGLISGTYTTMFMPGSTDVGGHDNFGQKMVDITTDLISGNMAILRDAYGWFMASEKLISHRETASRNQMIWKFYGKLIKSANEVLAAYESEEKVPDKSGNPMAWVEAKTVRAWAYFNLINIYAKNYKSHKDDLAIMYYRSDEKEAKGLVKVSEIYDFIKTDLEQAISAYEDVLDKSTPQKTKIQINYPVVSGILAYVYLTTEEYQKAYEMANNALTYGNYEAMDANEIVGGFNNVEKNPGWMWAADITVDLSGGLNTFWGHIDIYTYSYAYVGMRKVMDQNVYNKIVPNDIRKYQFDPKDGPVNKFYSSMGKELKGGDRQWLSDIHFLRASEMYLIKTEACIMDPNVGDAQEELNKLLVLRCASDVDDKYPAGQPEYGVTKEDIFDQWRIETWGEGRSLWAMKRLEMKVIRGDNHSELKNEEVNYDDERLTFTLPEVEVINNPNL